MGNKYYVWIALLVVILTVFIITVPGFCKTKLFEKKISKSEVSNSNWTIRVEDVFETSKEYEGGYGFKLKIQGDKQYELLLRDWHPNIRKMFVHNNRAMIDR